MRTEELKHIEAYLFNELSAEERATFEKRLQEDLAFANEVEQHRFFISKMKKHGQRKKMQQALGAIHDSLGPEDLKYQPQTVYKIRSVWNHYYPTIAVAASVALVTATAVLFSVDYLRSTEASYKELKRDVERIKKAQKNIFQQNGDKDDSDLPEPGLGATAFCVAKNGYLLTSYHVVKNADSVVVANEKYGDLGAKVVHADPEHDLALLHIEDKKFKSFGSIPFSLSSHAVFLGEKVFTLGFPKEDLVYADGSVGSATGFDGDEASIQVSVPVNPGNSGSPLFDDRGYVIGMISGKHARDEGASFAIKPLHLFNFIQSVPKSAAKNVKLNKSQSVPSSNRPKQVKKMGSFIFMVKVYR